MKHLYFTVRVPAHGTDGEPLAVGAVKQYIEDAVASWSGQFNPQEDTMFYWCAEGENRVQVTQQRRKKKGAKL